MANTVTKGSPWHCGTKRSLPAPAILANTTVRGIQQSMSRKENCLSNAVAKNFFGLLNSEPLYSQEFQSMEQFRQEFIACLAYCSTRRVKLN